MGKTEKNEKEVQEERRYAHLSDGDYEWSLLEVDNVLVTLATQSVELFTCVFCNYLQGCCSDLMICNLFPRQGSGSGSG